MLVPALSVSLALFTASCGSDEDGDGGSTDEFSIESLLDEVPASVATGSSSVRIVAGDLDLATEAGGGQRPSADDDVSVDELIDWIGPLTGVSRDDSPSPVHLLLPDAVSPQRLAENDAITDELGWSVVDVGSFIELQNPPQAFALLETDVEDEQLTAAAGEPDDGIWRLGGEDLEIDVAGSTPARPLGNSLRMAVDDGLLAVSRTTPPVTEWLDDEGDTIGDDEALASIAAALDDAGVYSATLLVTDFSIAGALGGRATPDQIAAIVEDADLIAPFDAIGVGLGIDDDGSPVATFVHHHANDDDAASNVDNIRTVFEDGVSFVNNRPLRELFDLRDVRADGPLVVTTVGFADDVPPGIVWQMLDNRDIVTAHA